MKKTMKNDIPPNEGLEVLLQRIKVVSLSRIPKLVANRSRIVLIIMVKMIILTKKKENIQNNCSFSMSQNGDLKSLK